MLFFESFRWGTSRLRVTLRVTALLAPYHTVVCPDLRGYGRSTKPPSDDHSQLSRRAMATDTRELMHSLGHDRFGIVGHDRGAAVAYRLALGLIRRRDEARRPRLHPERRATDLGSDIASLARRGLTF